MKDKRHEAQVAAAKRQIEDRLDTLILDRNTPFKAILDALRQFTDELEREESR
jgi:hypothetical protein